MTELQEYITTGMLGSYQPGRAVLRQMEDGSVNTIFRDTIHSEREGHDIKTSYVAPNLLNREFECHGPRAILLTGITYISNGTAPRCYTHEHRSYDPDSDLPHWLHIISSNANQPENGGESSDWSGKKLFGAISAKDEKNPWSCTPGVLL